MARAKELRRKTIMDKYITTFDTGKQFKNLSPEGKDRVYRRFYKWAEQAKHKGVAYWELPVEKAGLEEIEVDCLNSMIENACNGFDNGWAFCSKDDEPKPG